MNMLAPLTSPYLFTAVMAAALAMLLHINIRAEGWRPVFRQYRIRRALVIVLLTWAICVLMFPTP